MVDVTGKAGFYKTGAMRCWIRGMVTRAAHAAMIRDMLECTGRRNMR